MSMSEGSRKPLPSWREAMQAKGFGILCIRGPEGERFAIGAADPAQAATLQRQGFQVGTLVSEAELRAQFAQAGFSESDIEATIQFSRDWATTVTRAPDSKSVLGF